MGRYIEELFGRAGFFGPTAMLYHAGSPSEVLRVEGDVATRAASVTTAATSDRDDDRGDFTCLLENDDVRIGASRRRSAMPYCYRDALGDLLYFVHAGRGVFATEFGPLPYEPGDYVLLPKGTTFRHLPDGEDGVFFVVEARQPIRFTEHAQLGRHLPFDPSIVEVPSPIAYDWPVRDEWELRVKHAAGFTSIFLRNCPMDLIGWKGDLFPFKINIRDIIPVSSDRIHVAPSAWSTFENPAMMIVTFLPQMAVADLTAEELPSNHRNIDCDEAVFVHTDGRRMGGMLLHMPQALMHGSNKADRDAFNAARTPNMRRPLTGVSVDAFAPLCPTPAFLELSASRSA
ncbi:MAG: homogentisate 1,2-dioxygenase [Caulobacteraceae bacterium]|nr:homogentisate 1,2-dioxygenase [Caulobacteraceae bacterium]